MPPVNVESLPGAENRYSGAPAGYECRGGAGPDPRTHHKPNSHVRRWGAVYVLLVLFLGSWLGQFLTQLSEFRSDQEEHNQAFAWADFFPTFLASSFENWQSEWLQLVFQAILLLGAKHLIFRVDAEDMERLEAKVDKINRHLEDRQRA